MSESIYLHGSEQVQDAARSMQFAAETMNRAAQAFEDTFQRQSRFMDDWMTRFQDALETHAAKQVPPPTDSEPEPSGEDLTQCEGCTAIRPERELEPFSPTSKGWAIGDPAPLGLCPGCGCFRHLYTRS